MKIKKNDKVKIVAGKDRGREGVVERVLVKKGRIIVTGINLAKKHSRPKRGKGQGGIIDIAQPLSVANVVLVCPKCGQPTKVSYQQEKKGAKMRVCKKCKEGFI